MQLASPVYHIGFLPTVYKLLQCVCNRCFRLLADKSDPDFARAAKIKSGKKRLLAMLKLCRGRGKCLSGSGPSAVGGVGDDSVGCGAEQPKYRREGLKINLEYSDAAVENQFITDKKQVRPIYGWLIHGYIRLDSCLCLFCLQVLSAEAAYRVLRGISDDDAKLLGLDPRFARPEWLVLTGELYFAYRTC